MLGDPRLAMTWIANELRSHNIGLRAGEVINTGASVTPSPSNKAATSSPTSAASGLLQRQSRELAEAVDGVKFQGSGIASR